jgi:ribokinase
MMDLVMRVPRRPRPGETVFGTEFGIFLGGKGFNQAIAARRLGGAVAMVGRVGDDDFGGQLRAALRREGVDASGLVADVEAGTGVAAPVIEATGDNSIISVPRANMRLTAADVRRASGAFRAARAVLLQLEVPSDASLAAARLGRAAGARVLLNTAPAGSVPDELLAAADVLIANEVEAAALSGVAVRSVEEAFTAAALLQRHRDQTAIVTLGAEGAIAVRTGLRRHAPAYRVPVLDTTGAGDAFCAALAVRLMETEDLADALAWANAAGACAVTVLGAEPSLPTRAAVEAVLRSGA